MKKNQHLIGLLLLLIPFLPACKSQATKSPVSPGFCLTDSLQNSVEIREVESLPVKKVVDLSGKIEANEDKWVKVYPVVSGVVDEMKVQLGDYVTKGQVLAIVRSGEIADYQHQLAIAESNQKLMEKNLGDTKQLLLSGLATERDLVAAQTEYDKAGSELKRIQQTTAIYGAGGNAIQQIRAPVSGYVIEKNITDKMQYRVDAALPFFIIANLDEVWVMASVFESDIAKVKTGYNADIQVLAYPDKNFTGKVDRIFSILDPQSRVMKVRIRIPNTGSLLKPEMFAQIHIKYDEGDLKLPAIPSQAVIFDKNKNYVMVYKERCKVEAREIQLYETIGNTTYVQSGLQPGEKVITRYQLLVYDALTD